MINEQVRSVEDDEAIPQEVQLENSTEILILKLKIQEEVMKRLGFVRPSFDSGDFSESNYKLPDAEEEKARSWASVENVNGETRSQAFNVLYEKELEKYPNKKLSADQENEIIEKIVVEMNKRKAEWS